VEDDSMSEQPATLRVIEPSPEKSVLDFLGGAIKEHLHATARLTRARDEADRLRSALAAAEQTVREAERDHSSSTEIVRDALSLAREMSKEAAR
jgi:hypothetical protein